MKTDLNGQTKYFWKEIDKKTMKFKLTEIPLNKENWFYVQVDASIRTSFYKYNFQIPSFVIVTKLSHYMLFEIVRDKINKKELLDWSEKYNFLCEELKHQAQCNSSDEYECNDWIKYEFKII